jgi:hypothetical protein
MVAVTSHLPQVTASLLAATVGAAERVYANGAFMAAGGGFRDTTRVADSTISMWRPVIEGNRTMIATLLDDLTSRAAALSEALRRGDMDAVEALFKEAHEARDAWRTANELSYDEHSATVTNETPRWFDSSTGETAWIDRSFGWETVRTSAEDPDRHASVAARFLASEMGLEIDPTKTEEDGGRLPNYKKVARETWTADGLPVNGITLHNRFVVLT